MPVRLDMVGCESCVESVDGRGGGGAGAEAALRALGLEERERGGSWTEYCNIVRTRALGSTNTHSQSTNGGGMEARKR